MKTKNGLDTIAAPTQDQHHAAKMPEMSNLTATAQAVFLEYLGTPKLIAGWPKFISKAKIDT